MIEKGDWAMDILILVVTLFGCIVIGMIVGEKLRNRRKK
jgi:hypothetical protein